MALRAVTSNGVAITPSSLTVSGTLTGSSGTATAASISPTINQSGTAGYTALYINPTETATGSGTKLLQRWAVGGTAQSYVSNTGVFAVTGLTSVGVIGFGASLGSTDLTFVRDAADILALRRSTNAQTFLVYNTYTDGSNYERGIFAWVGSSLFVGAEAAGTGTKRSTNISGSAVGISPFSGSTSTAWFWATTGHYLAQTDNTYDIGASGANRPRNLYVGTDATIGGVVVASGFVRGATLRITDGVAAPTTVAGFAQIYVDTADGDLKIIFGDGTIKTIVTDT